MQTQPFENCPDVACLITAIVKPEPAKVIRVIPLTCANKTIRVPVAYAAANESMPRHA